MSESAGAGEPGETDPAAEETARRAAVEIATLDALRCRFAARTRSEPTDEADAAVSEAVDAWHAATTRARAHAQAVIANHASSPAARAQAERQLAPPWGQSAPAADGARFENFAGALSDLLRDAATVDDVVAPLSAGGVGVIELRDMSWPWVEATRSRSSKKQLFVRECTRDIVRVIESQRLEDGFDGMVVTGNPGIGKSWTLHYFMLHYLLLGKTVVFESVQAGCRWVLQRAAAEERQGRQVVIQVFERLRLLAALHDRDTVYLFDPSGTAGAQEPAYCDGFTIICAPPNPAHYQHFNKSNHTDMHVVPVWTVEELQAAARHLGRFDDDDDAVAERVRVAGGIPRRVLSSKPLDELEAEIRQAVGLLTPAGHGSYELRMLESTSDGSYHYRTSYEFLSVYTKQLVLETVVQWGVEGNLRSPAAGALFEKLMRDQLVPGGHHTIVVRPLEPQNVETPRTAWTMPVGHGGDGEAGRLQWPQAQSVPTVMDAYYCGTLTPDGA